MKQVLIPLVGVAAFVVFVGLLVQGKIKIPVSTVSPKPTSQTVTLGDKTITVEMADTKALREKGLSGRTSIDESIGMLFVFDGEKNVSPQFWMKGMLFPIDIIWIDDGKIVKIDKNVPVPASNAPDSSLAILTFNKPVDYVLEVKAGFSDSNNLKIGDTAEGDPIQD